LFLSRQSSPPQAGNPHHHLPTADPRTSARCCRQCPSRPPDAGRRSSSRHSPSSPA